MRLAPLWMCGWCSHFCYCLHSIVRTKTVQVVVSACVITFEKYCTLTSREEERSKINEKRRSNNKSSNRQGHYIAIHEIHAIYLCAARSISFLLLRFLRKKLKLEILGWSIALLTIKEIADFFALFVFFLTLPFVVTFSCWFCFCDWLSHTLATLKCWFIEVKK